MKPKIIILLFLLISTGAIYIYKTQVLTKPIAPPTSPELAWVEAKLQTINVLQIMYYPLDGEKLDTKKVIKDTYGEYNMTLHEVKTHVKETSESLIKSLEMGTKYHGYKNPDNPNYLTYNVINSIEKISAFPISNTKYRDKYLLDYKKMMSDINICDYVDSKKVYEIWIWGYGGTGPESGWESNFSSKYGDISNSNRDNDLPICSHSYTVYTYNYGRGVPEALEDHMHQYEAIFKHVDGNLFWNEFVGTNSILPKDKLNHCGWAHFPPNGERDYDWANTTVVTTDCEDWNATHTGITTEVNCTKWNCNSKDYFIWWMQNIPSSWWQFIGDFDTATVTYKNLR